MEQKLTISVDDWAVEKGCTDCAGCPALQWAVVRDQEFPCQLGYIVQNTAGKLIPKEACCRPKTIGAAYLIAKALGRPEPLVGKLSKKDYERYLAGKEAAGC